VLLCLFGSNPTKLVHVVIALACDQAFLKHSLALKKRKIASVRKCQIMEV